MCNRVTIYVHKAVDSTSLVNVIHLNGPVATQYLEVR